MSVRRATFALLLAGELWLAQPAGAATEVCGVLPGAADWVKAKSPYLVTNDVYVAPNSRLAIEAGVTVQFAPHPLPCRDELVQADRADSDFVSLKVDGALYVLGNAENPVLFEPQEFRPGISGWDGIRLRGRQPMLVDIRFAVFRGADRALQAWDSRFDVRNSVFEENNAGIYLEDAANLTITNNNFIHNRACGVCINGSNPVIQNSIFGWNTIHGIWSDSRVSMKIQYNNFWKNLEGPCFKCPGDVLQFTGKNRNGDSADTWMNTSLDPMFLGSKSHQQAETVDVETPTPLAAVQDTNLAKLERKGQKNWRKPKPAPPPLGHGRFLLSPYSKLRNAGNPADIYKDRDGSVNDIGVHGGRVPEIKRY